MAEARYHVRFADEASGEELGLLLTESPQLGFSRRLINPYAAKAGMGATEDSDLTEWSVVSWRDWRGGRGQEELEEGTAFFDAWNLETRIERQVTLGALNQNVGLLAEDYPKHEPGDVVGAVVGMGIPVRQMSRNLRLRGLAQLQIGRDLGQRFLVPTGVTALSVDAVSVHVRRIVGTAALRVAVYSDSGGVPGAELAYQEIAAGTIETDQAEWCKATLETDLAVTPGSHYWVVLATTGTARYEWSVLEGSRYPDGYYAYKSGAAWIPLGWVDATFKIHWAVMAQSMSFEAPVGGMSSVQVELFIRTGNQYIHPTSTLTIRLCEDDGGKPGTVLQSKIVPSPPYSHAWVVATWPSPEALTGEQTYHVTAESPAQAEGDYWEWGADSGGGYGDGAANRKVGEGDWSGVGVTEDLYFRTNPVEIDGTVIGLVRYEGNWYVAGENKVYEWDEVNKLFGVSFDGEWDPAVQATDMAVWGGYLWVAWGDDYNVRRYNGDAWGDASVKANLLRSGGGYLHRTGTGSDEHMVYYLADPAGAWSAAIEAGAGDYGITAMVWYRDMLVMATAVRLWGLAAEMVYPLLDWHSQEDADNGKGMLAWSRTGCLYIPLRFGLYRWNGDTMVAVGPEQEGGLPANRAGRIVDMCGTGNWLYAAVNAGTGYSSILAYNGMGGWHEVFRCQTAGQSVVAMGFETIHSPNRVWFGLGSGGTRYLMMPDYSDDPYQWEGFEFNPTGDMETSWVGGDLLEVVKDLYEVVVRGEDITAGRPVDVFYEVDRSGRWTYLGRVAEVPRRALSFIPSDFVAKVVGGGSTRETVELAAGSTTTDMEEGDWCRIDGEVRQVASITDSDTFVLETALSAAPVAGEVVYASRPAGREFRLKLVLSTNDKGETPKVKAVFVRFQNNVLDRFVYQLTVQVGDGMTDLAGNAYPHTAADLRVALDGWAKRKTPFRLYDPDGEMHTVKVIGVGEGGYTREGGALPNRYRSVYSLNLVEVG